MKRIGFTCLVLAVLMLSCQKIEKSEKPDQLLSKSEMKDLIYDMILLDAAASVNQEKLNELGVDMLEYLSKKYKIDSSSLKKNIKYYNLRFDENLEIYEEVKDSITKLENAYDSISRARDSLRKLELKKLDTTDIKKIDKKIIRSKG